MESWDDFAAALAPLGPAWFWSADAPRSLWEIAGLRSSSGVHLRPREPRTPTRTPRAASRPPGLDPDGRSGRGGGSPLAQSLDRDRCGRLRSPPTAGVGRCVDPRRIRSPSMNSAFLRAVGAGFLLGAAGAGTPIACLHVMANPGAPVSDAAILGFVCALFYGGWLGASVAVVGTVNRLRSHRGARDPSPVSRLRMTRAPSRSRQESGEGGLAGGIALFVWLFGCGYFLHGLTYDQLPASLPATRWMMAGFVVAITGGVLVGALLLGRVLARGLGVLNARRFAMPVALTVLAASAALPSALAWPRAPRSGRIGLEQLSRPTRQQLLAPHRRSRSSSPHRWLNMQPVSHLALVGLDGADWRVLQPLLDQGQLPHFARLVADGVSGPLATIPDSNSAVIWASIYTGKRAGATTASSTSSASPSPACGAASSRFTGSILRSSPTSPRSSAWRACGR